MNHYEILGIDEETIFADIKLAYQRLASKYHPDKNDGDEGAAEKFKEVRAAYEFILENPPDPNRKKQENKVEVPEKPFVSSLDDSFISRKCQDQDVSVFKNAFDSNELGFGGHQADGSILYRLSLEQAYNGGDIEIDIPNYAKTLVKLPPLTNNKKIKVDLGGLASWMPQKSSVNVHFIIAQHKIYSIVKGDLICNFNMSLAEVLKRNVLNIPHPNGKNFMNVQIPVNFQLGSSLSLPDLGFEFTEFGVIRLGNIIINIFVKMPELTNDQLVKILEIL